MSDSFATPWTVARWAPLSWDFPSKNTGVGCHFLLQGTLKLTNVICKLYLSWKQKTKNPGQTPPYPVELDCLHHPDVTSTGPSSNSCIMCSPPTSRPPASELPIELIKNTDFCPPCLQSQAFWALPRGVYFRSSLWEKPCCVYSMTTSLLYL